MKEQLEQEGMLFCKAQHRPCRSMGQTVYGGSIPADVKEQLQQEGVDQVLATASAFFAKLSTAHVAAWGGYSDLAIQ